MTSRHFSIMLPSDLAEAVEAKVRSGAYASADHLINESLKALIERDDAEELWLREDVVAGHADHLADPSQAVPLDAVLDRIKARRVGTI